MPSQYLIAALSSKGEKSRWRGISHGNLVMLMVQPATNKWTIIATNPGAISCIVAFGTEAEMVIQAMPIAPIAPQIHDR